MYMYVPFNMLILVSIDCPQFFCPLVWIIVSYMYRLFRTLFIYFTGDACGAAAATD